MALCGRLLWFLSERGASFELLPHGEAFTAERVAQICHVPGRELAKVVVLGDEGRRPWMAVLPASCRLDVAALGQAIGHPHLALLREEELARLFPDCELGAMPPFGELYGMNMVVDACFPRTRPVFFQAGNHRELVAMPYRDYERLAHPQLSEFCLHQRFPARRGH
ncbi:MAG TPA: YbaK/EbsC family protein [Vicinamibacteria bacterium]